jgi:glutamate racemase
MNKQSPIGVFDSGIGGLSVLKQLIRFLPYEKYVYLGDTARVPYGNKSPKTVQVYAEQCTNFLLSKGVKLIVVACNTVSSVALDAVKNAAGDKVPVIGMIEPAAGAALRGTNNKKIGIIGTRATVNSGAYAGAINRLGGKKIEVLSAACPLFVPIAEEGMDRHPAAKLIAEEYLAGMKEAGVDTLVLGCTHYPLLADLFREILPGINLIDSGEHSSVQALRILADKDLLIETGKEFLEKPALDFFVTDLPAMFYDLANRFLGFKIEKPKVIELG